MYEIKPKFKLGVKIDTGKGYSLIPRQWCYDVGVGKVYYYGEPLKINELKTIDLTTPYAEEDLLKHNKPTNTEKDINKYGFIKNIQPYNARIRTMLDHKTPKNYISENVMELRDIIGCSDVVVEKDVPLKIVCIQKEFTKSKTPTHLKDEIIIYGGHTLTSIMNISKVVSELLSYTEFNALAEKHRMSQINKLGTLEARIASYRDIRQYARENIFEDINSSIASLEVEFKDVSDNVNSYSSLLETLTELKSDIDKFVNEMVVLNYPLIKDSDSFVQSFIDNFKKGDKVSKIKKRKIS